MATPGEPAGVDEALGEEVGRGWCPHLAMLLSSLDELHPALAAFYRLGAGRNGWVFHRSLPEHEARDRAGLEAAGLDVASLEAEGRFALSEAPVTEPPESWAEPLLPVIDERLGGGLRRRLVVALPGRRRRSGVRARGPLRRRVGRRHAGSAGRLALRLHRRGR